MSASMPDDAAPDTAPPPPRRDAGETSSPAWTDARLVRECVRGNENAWAMLLEKYKRLIYSIPIKYGLSPDEATDVFQDVCVELLSELPRLREPRALPKWLMQVTSRRCLRLRGQSTRTAGPTGDAQDELMQRLADARPLSDQIMLEVEREQALRDAIATLAPRCRQMVEMLFLETPPRSYQDVARSLQLETGSIGFIRGRCLQRLRTALQKAGFR
jgi:RNA polymerase sigma factor (sigma-70 family)